MQDEEPIDPGVARFVRGLMEGYAAYPDLDSRPLPERRAIAEKVRAPWREGGPLMYRVTNLTAPTPAGQVKVRLFEARASKHLRPALVYAHGGGFTSFSLDTHDRLMREYADRTGAVVVGVDYSLSPEVKFPVALNEIVGVVYWLGAAGTALGIDPARIAVGGDSAGANLALATALSLRDARHGDRVRALLLNYGFFDADSTTASHAAHGGDDKLLTSVELAWYLDNYLAGTPHRENPLAIPMLAELHDLPPSFHVIAQCDPLRDSDLKMAERLRVAGGEVEAHVYKGATHSFLEAMSVAPLADQALLQSSEWLVKKLA